MKGYCARLRGLINAPKNNAETFVIQHMRLAAMHTLQASHIYTQLLNEWMNGYFGFLLGLITAPQK